MLRIDKDASGKIFVTHIKLEMENQIRQQNTKIDNGDI